MGEHFRKEVPASDNVSLSLYPFLLRCEDEGRQRRNGAGLKKILMFFLLFSRFKEENRCTVIRGGKEGGQGDLFGKRNRRRREGAWRRVEIPFYLIMKVLRGQPVEIIVYI